MGYLISVFSLIKDRQKMSVWFGVFTMFCGINVDVFSSLKKMKTKPLRDLNWHVMFCVRDIYADEGGLIFIHLVWFLKLTQLRYIVLKTYWTAFASHGMIECICTWEYCWHKVVRRIFLLNRDFVCRPRWKQISKQNHWWIEEPETKNLSTSMDQGHCDDGIQ